MSLETINSQFGKGGTGIPNLGAILGELQGLTFSLLTGGTANAKINLTDIRLEDTVAMAINNNAGTLTDVTSTISLVDTHATGTITVGTLQANDACVVNGRTYTAKVAPSAVGEFKIGANANESAANLAAAIIYRERVAVQGQALPEIQVSVSTNVITLRAEVDGTAGNSLVLTGSTRLVVTGSGTLTNGTATGGIKSTGATNQVLLIWYKKVR
jgi:hypothetical protein